MFGGSLLEFLKAHSFSSPWFWALFAVTWGIVLRRILGIPSDVAKGAFFGEPQALLEFDGLAEFKSKRLLRYRRYVTPVSIGIAFFALSGILVLGFFYGFELAQALFLLAAPLGITLWIRYNAATQILDKGLEGEALRRLYLRVRFRTQITAVCGIAATLLWSQIVLVLRQLAF